MAPAESFANCWLPWSGVENIVSRARYKSEALFCSALNNIPKVHICCAKQSEASQSHQTYYWPTIIQFYLCQIKKSGTSDVHIKIYLSFSWEWLLRECFICRPENVNASSILETKVWNWRCLDKERLKFWTNEQIEDPTIMTGQNVFHRLTKREELLLKNYLLEIPISSRRPIPSWSYKSSAPCRVQIVSPKIQLGFFYQTQARS